MLSAHSTKDLQRNAIAWLEKLAVHGGNGEPKNPLFLKHVADVLADHVRELARRAGE